MPRFRPFASLTDPQTYHLFIQAVGILAGMALVWAVAICVLWAGGIFICLLLVIGLAVTVFHLDRKQKIRETWILAGCCGQCGYDLRAATSSICPECGHDVSAEEPTWRKRQREHRLQIQALQAQPPHLPGLPDAPVDLTPAPRVR